jgi:hypothetical protein
MEFRKLTVAGLKYRLHLVLGLLRDWNDAIEVLVNEQAHEQLHSRRNENIWTRSRSSSVDRLID